MKTKMIMVKLGVGLLVLVTACSTAQSPSPRPEEPEGVLYTPVPTVVEPGLAYSEPCQPPCWRGIIPGKTTKQEAARAIEQLRSSGWASYIEEGPKGYAIQPLPDTPSGSIGLLFENDVVSKIAGGVAFYYPIGNMIKQLGVPEATYRAGRNQGAKERTCTDWEPPDYSASPVQSVPVQLLYPQQGLYFLALVPISGFGLICPEMKIVSFCYYPPLSLQDALNNNYLANLCGLDGLKGVAEEDLVKWHGYGSGY
jgi:hypothetical protein